MLAILRKGATAARQGGHHSSCCASTLNPRSARNVALTFKPTETSERGQWYFQRHVASLPDLWCEFVTLRPVPGTNRAGSVEPVMGCCTPDNTLEVC